MTFLVDYNLDGYALVFLGILTKLGWLELISIRFVTFREAGLSMESNDRVVWCFAQANQMNFSICAYNVITIFYFPKRAKHGHSY